MMSLLATQHQDPSPLESPTLGGRGPLSGEVDNVRPASPAFSEDNGFSNETWTLNAGAGRSGW